jgi:hypothetical protein
MDGSRDGSADAEFLRLAGAKSQDADNLERDFLAVLRIDVDDHPMYDFSVFERELKQMACLSAQAIWRISHTGREVCVTP